VQKKKEEEKKRRKKKKGERKKEKNDKKGLVVGRSPNTLKAPFLHSKDEEPSPLDI
jgi:hypothetical protein